MKALVYTGKNTVVFRDEPDPVPGNDEVLVKIDACGVCGSDMHAYHGHDGFREFSHRKSIYHQIKWDLPPLRMLRPPYGAGLAKYLSMQIKR